MAEYTTAVMTVHASDVSDDLAVAERCALMRAGVADRKELVADAKHRNRSPSRLHGHRGAGREFARLSDRIIRHVLIVRAFLGQSLMGASILQQPASPNYIVFDQVAESFR